MIELSVRRPVATAALYVALLALGAYSFGLIPLELLPDVSYPRLTVTATWRGASPESMEASVTAPLESAVQLVPGVRNVTSRSYATPRGPGSRSEIDVEFARDTRMQFARLELTERIAALEEELPPGIRPLVSPYVPDEFSDEQQDFLTWQIHGPFTPGRLTEEAREILVPVIAGVEGVADVLVAGAEPRELAIELDRERLESLDVRPADVRSQLQDISAPRPVGAVPLDGRVTALTVRTRAESVAELENLVVSTGPAGTVRLADVARIRDQAAEPTGYHRIDGRPAVTLEVYRSSGTNAVDVADRAKAAMDSASAELPPGVRVELDQDRSEDIRAQLSDLRLRALAAAVVIFLVLTVFLRSLGSVLVVFATIGFSVLIAVNLLFLGGFSLNVLTLAGLAWGFGLVVDNGIVVLENVDRYRARGSPPERASVEGARQVLLPVVAATATTGIVLVPF
ncbi:MAG: efflux RND transporter permease subunit, partial [Gemmatimonadota bacterium]